MQESIFISQAKYAIGARVRHALLEYHGLVMDVDPMFCHREAFAPEKLENIPHKEKPWYHVLVHGTQHVTYVSEENLLPDLTTDEFEHPVMDMLFTRDEAGQYQWRRHLQ